MSLGLPTFEDTDCQALSLCCMVHPDRLESIAAEDSVMVSGYNVRDGRASLQLAVLKNFEVPNRDYKFGHFHVDTYAPKYFRKLPKSTHKKSSILRAMVRLGAERTAVVPAALFRAPRSHARLFYSSLGQRVDLKPGSTVEMTSAEFEFRKTQLERIRIALHGDSCMVQITGRGGLLEAIDSDLIINTFDMLDSAYKGFAKGARK